MADSVETYSRKKIIPVFHTNSEGEVATSAVRALSERNWQEQCYLMERAHDLSLRRDPGGNHAKVAEHYYKIVPPGKHGTGASQDFGADIIPSLLSKFAGADALHTAPPHVISAMVPYIRIYKVFYKTNANSDQSSSTNQYDTWLKNADADQLSIPFDFNIHTTFDSVGDILKGTSGRTDDVGLKRFSYNFHGKDVVTKDIVKCGMTLHFNSVEGLIKERTARVGPNNSKFTWSWQDLILTRVISQTEQSLQNLELKEEAKNYEIKVELGWSGNEASKQILAPGDPAAQLAYQSMISDAFRKTLFLTLMSHTIEFNQDGSMDLSIEFIGRSTSRWNSQNWELLYLAENDAGVDEKELVQLEKETLEEIKRLKEELALEEAEKKKTQAAEQAKKTPGAIDLDIANAEDYLNAAIDGSGEKEEFDQADEVKAAINNAGPDWSQDEPNVKGIESKKEKKILDKRDVSLSQRELYVLQFRLQRLRASRRGMAYQRLFKKMDPIIHRIRLARSELGELKTGQLKKSEANKARQPYYVEHKIKDSGLSEQELKEANKLWEARSLSRAFDSVSLDDIPGALTAQEKIQQGFGKVLEEGDPDFKGMDNTFNDKYGKNNSQLVETSGDMTNEGLGLINQEQMQKDLETMSNKRVVYEAAYDEVSAEDPSAASRLEGEPADVMILEYFYLGDLIDQLIGHIKENPDFVNQRGDDERQIVFAPIRYEHPLLAGLQDSVATTMFVNLADIPISARYFNSWFRKNYILKLQDSITFDEFFKRLVEGLVFGALGEQCYYGSKNAQSNLGLKTLLTSKKLDTLPIGINRSANQDKDRVAPHHFHPAWTEKVLGATWQENFLNTKGHQQLYEYYILYANSYVPSFLTGNPSRDITKGIHHIFIGANKGLMKNITFQKITQPSIQAYKIAASGARDAREIYEMKMSMIGNNYFEPGQLVYINPVLAGLGSVNREKQILLQKSLGLGGYFRINKVDGVVEAGNFETIVAGYWETFGKELGTSLADATTVSTGFGPLGIGDENELIGADEKLLEVSKPGLGNQKDMTVGPFSDPGVFGQK